MIKCLLSWNTWLYKKYCNIPNDSKIKSVSKRKKCTMGPNDKQANEVDIPDVCVLFKLVTPFDNVELVYSRLYKTR